MKQRTSVRALLSASDDVIYAPGTWSALSAKLAQLAGFEAVCAGGFPIAGAIGLPDVDLYTQADVLSVVRDMERTIDVPIVADIDAGYGSVANVRHTVRQFERAGASALFIEDQAAPKRCPFLKEEPVPVVSIEQGVSRVRAAVDARLDAETVIIARTDAWGEEIHRRAEAYAAAGADMILPIALNDSFDETQWRKLADNVGLPLVATPMPDNWQERRFTREVMSQIGVRLAMHPLTGFYAAIQATLDAFKDLRAGRPAEEIAAEGYAHTDYVELIGYNEVVDHLKAYDPGNHG